MAGTTISPWIVSLDVLEPFRCETSAGKQSDPEPLEYLQDPNYSSYDIELEVPALVVAFCLYRVAVVFVHLLNEETATPKVRAFSSGEIHGR